jgi:hypothetical protein
MANISRVKLTIAPIAGQLNQRKVTVNYEIRFNAAEELAGTVFKEYVRIKGSDPGPDEYLFKLKSLFVRAQAGVVIRNFSKIVDRNKLDEDDDLGFFGGKIRFQDEVYAQVCLIPFTPSADSANSEEIIRFF